MDLISIPRPSLPSIAMRFRRFGRMSDEFSEIQRFVPVERKRRSYGGGGNYQDRSSLELLLQIFRDFFRSLSHNLKL